MGTNYYHHTDVCEHCKRGDEAEHIGKSSGGWTFSFHGTGEIRSYEQWLRVLEAGGEIRDECDQVVTLDDFKALVASKLESKNRHYDWMQENAHQSMYDEWLDDDGHSFSGGEFC